jgi:hypothetical protein
MPQPAYRWVVGGTCSWTVARVAQLTVDRDPYKPAPETAERIARGIAGAPDGRGHVPFRAAHSAGQVGGGDRVVDPISDHDGLTGHNKVGPC